MWELLWFLLAAAGASPSSPAYTAEIVTVHEGRTSRGTVWSDGVRRRTESVNEKGERSGSLVDSSKKLWWLYGTGFSCLQMPAKPKGASSHEEAAGVETIDGHPTRKFKVTSTFDDGKKKMTSVVYEWRATDLRDLVIQSRSLDGGDLMNLRNIKPGVPDATPPALPADCKYDEMADETGYAPEPAGAFRSIRFSDASCKRLVPLPLTLSIPSDYAIRRAGPNDCVWGTSDDLARALSTSDQIDFESIKRGVFWCRISASTDFDPIHGVFVNPEGTDDQWPSAMAREGGKNIVIKHLKIGALPALTVTASMGGRRVYMLYLGVLDSPAILINYHPAGKGGSADDAVWSHFVESIHVER